MCGRDGWAWERGPFAAKTGAVVLTIARGGANRDLDGKDITVFYEPPSLTGPGHIIYLAENQATGDAAAMSFGPVRDSEYFPFTALGSPVNSTKTFGLVGMTADDLRHTYASITIQTSPKDAQEVIEFIRRLSTSTTPYELYRTNCTTVCVEALKAIGILPSNNSDWTPRELWFTLFPKYANPRWQNPLGWSGQHPGTDYGHPPTNYDPFDLLELLSNLDQDDSSVTTSYGPSYACTQSNEGGGC